MKQPVNIFRDEAGGITLWLTNIGKDSYGNKSVWIARGDHADDLWHNRKIRLAHIPEWRRKTLPTVQDISGSPRLVAALKNYYCRYCLAERQTPVPQRRGIRI
ncbi:MAG: hypothetical protein LBH01_03985 [Verrucomicrobiales bacterium]|jgi:hypothetical protein|nr:hypothetical protein [Verrucomicrobiales bacterium]